MHTHRILFVGNSFHTHREYLEKNGYEYITLKDITATKFPDKKLKRRVVCDFSSMENVLQTVDELNTKHRIDAIMVAYEQYVKPAAIIAAHLGLPGLPLSAAEACTDKFTMRQMLANAPRKISPDFQVLTSEQDVRDFAAKHQFPLIIKPANLTKSLLVSKNHDLDELLKNYQHTLNVIDDVYAKYAPHATPKLLIEEFMEGPVHSVDAFIDAAGTPHVLDAVVDYETGYDIGYDDNFHYSRLLPSRLQPNQLEDIREVARLGCQALGMKSSPAHIELILAAEGSQIVEIGARNGGYRERMHALANQIDIQGNALRIALGQKPVIANKQTDHVGVFELFPRIAGNFEGIENEDGLAALSSLEYYDLKATVGSHVGKSSDGYKMCAVVILYNRDAQQFAHDIAYLKEKVHVKTSPDQPEGL